MSLIIDGYNLIHAANIVGRGRGPRSLERSRQALLDALTSSLEAPELARTTVVFDAQDAPPGLARTFEHRGLRVRFAARYADADSLIEELIRADSAPRSLTVVSSDHRLQRAARKRRAKAIDSDVWFAGLIARRRRGNVEAAPPKAKRDPKLTPTEVDYWLDQFALSEAESQAADDLLPPELDS